MFSTADLSDHNLDARVCNLQFNNYGGRDYFYGPCFPLRVQEDHRPVDEMVCTPGEGRVLVVDSAASLRIGVLGDRLAALAAKNGWAGVVINGAIRDSVLLKGIDLGVKALGATALRGREAQASVKGQPVEFGGVRFEEGGWIYADQDAVLVSKVKLALIKG